LRQKNRTGPFSFFFLNEAIKVRILKSRELVWLPAVFKKDQVNGHDANSAAMSLSSLRFLYDLTLRKACGRLLENRAIICTLRTRAPKSAITGTSVSRTSLEKSLFVIYVWT
jgi:hypothetical protein